MGRNIRSLVMAGGLGVATIATFTGCATGDRSTGQYIDDRMTARRVKSELGNNPIFKFEDVSVSTYRGVVQLNGWVTQAEQKQVAEQIVKNVPGVMDVVNNLSMKPEFQLVTPTTGSATGRPASETTETQGEASRELQREQQQRQEQIQREQQRQEQPQDQP